MIPHYKLATKEFPLRCSKLDEVVKCAMRIRMLAPYEDDEGGAAAQNGSLIHVGAAAFHKEASSLHHKKKAAWDAIAAHAAKFPLHEEAEVRLGITPYMDDPRNIEAEFELINGDPAIEVAVQFQLPPHPLDTTEQPIYVTGTMDQLRREKGMKRVWDIKSGKKTGWEMLHLHAIQISAYTHGARTFLNIGDCEPGGFIRTMGYRTRAAAGVSSPDGVFFNCPYDYNFGMILLENVRLNVALYRMGYIEFGPGPHCTYCEHGGLGGCSHTYTNLVQLGLL
jgi:hypothetical protein